MQFSPGTPLVSVILPSFNHAAFVGEAAQTVLDQTFSDLELIVVDDGSSDGTADIVAAIRDPRLTLIRLSENRAVHSRNLALS
jgi:glycosyltransferase involved in cell wall biosynthesis